MAGDWIKMRHCLWTHPKVVTLMKRLSVTRCAAVGALYRAWCIADTHAEDDGTLAVDGTALDEMAEMPGLAAAMEAVGWLKCGPGDLLQFLSYQEHNGTTAKARDQLRKRVSRHRQGCNASVTVDRYESVTREEKRREE